MEMSEAMKGNCSISGYDGIWEVEVLEWKVELGELLRWISRLIEECRQIQALSFQTILVIIASNLTKVWLSSIIITKTSRQNFSHHRISTKMDSSTFDTSVCFGID
jgi:hypothetical protein